jgi:cytochrome c oxidase subunit 2
VIFRRVKPRLLVGAVLLLSFVFLSTGCDIFDSPQNTFSPEGDVASRQRDLFLLVMWPALVIGVLVFAALVYILVRFRQRRPDEPPPVQMHGNQRLELMWTILPTILLVVLAFPTVDGIVDLGRDPKPDAMPVTVHAFRWDWTFEYPEIMTADGKPLRVNRELHLPVDREIAITLESSDVIHSFWVPKLAGKLDVMPGRSNRMWLNATSEGTYSGQCVEFCGLGHAVMRFDAVVQSEDDFQAWVDEHLAGGDGDSAAPEGDQPASGE